MTTRKPPAAGKGRPKGSANKTTTMLKEAILGAATATGKDGSGEDGLMGYCAFLATSEPKAFATLLGRVLPMQVTGEDGGPIQVTAVERIIVRPKDTDSNG